MTTNFDVDALAYFCHFLHKKNYHIITYSDNIATYYSGICLSIGLYNNVQISADGHLFYPSLLDANS